MGIRLFQLFNSKVETDGTDGLEGMNWLEGTDALEGIVQFQCHRY